MLLNLQDLRQDYAKLQLDIKDVAPNPLKQFEQWFQEALDAKVLEPNAMVLATVNKDSKPSARVVLLKEVNDNGFVFFTNYESKKGQELAQNPHAALVFNWLELHRQIRIEGQVSQISAEASKAYFQSRPKGSQIGAWASPQSQTIATREELEEKVKAIENKYQDQEVLPLPQNWGGYLLTPTLVEFWQGRPSRLHDRIEYTKTISGAWELLRLAP